MSKNIYLKPLKKRSFRLSKHLMNTNNLYENWIYFKILFLFNKKIQFKQKKNNKNLNKFLLKYIDYNLKFK